MTATAADVRLAGVCVQIGARKLLDGIDLTVPPGQRVALIGASGAGKSTLLRLCAGLLQPTQGCVTVLGQDTSQLRGKTLCQLRARVGMMHQQDNLVPGLRVAHNVLMGYLGQWSLARAVWSLLFPQQLDRAAAALARVELADRLWSLPGELSGGEQQRVAIARLLLQEPRLVLADEPVSSLDVRLGREVIKLLLEVAANQRTALVSLHALDLLAQGFQRVIALREGRLCWDGPPESLSHPQLREIYGAEYGTLHLDEWHLPEPTNR